MGFLDMAEWMLISVWLAWFLSFLSKEYVVDTIGLCNKWGSLGFDFILSEIDWNELKLA